MRPRDGGAHPSGAHGVDTRIRRRRFYEVLANSALNRVPASSATPLSWTISSYRGYSHACSFCFANNTHTHLDLDAGKDFDREIIAKKNVVAVLVRERARLGWNHEPVALGTNTDRYQRAGGRYRLMPGIIANLADSGAPFSILTKGKLLRCDLPLLAQANRQRPAGSTRCEPYGRAGWTARCS